MHKEPSTLDVRRGMPDGPLPLAGQSGLPKYMLLRNALVNEIAEGRWAPGERLPAEDVLARMAALSLGTVQRSLRMLVEEGRLVRRHGAGTFVADPDAGPPMGGPFRHFRFLDDNGVGILPIYTKVLKRFAVKAPGAWSAQLKAAQPVCIDRLFSINNEFSLYVHTYFDGRRFPELASMDTGELTGVSLKDLMSRRYHQPTAGYTERLRVCVFPAPICRALKIAPDTSGAQLELVARDDRGDAIYVQYVYVPPNERALLVLPE
jgi:GntR family transcriptional regulator